MRDRRPSVRCLALILVILSGTAALPATETQRWIVDTAEDFLKGHGDGVAVHEGGRLVPVPAWSEAVSFDEPVVFAGALEEDGSLIVGTGHPARLYRVRGAKRELITEVPGDQITSVLVERDGAILVATMAPGVLYRWSKGSLDEVGRLGDGGFWDLVEFDGQVVAAAGPPAALYRLGSNGLERWLEVPDSHVRCLDAADDTLFLGTSGKGLIFSVDRRGRLGLLSDSRFTEISDLAWAPDGSVWATALVGEPPPKPKSSNGGTSTAEAASDTGTVDLDLPKVNGATATSEVVRLTPEGALLRVHRFSKQVATALARDGESVLVGTGYEGEVWRFVVSGGARLATVDAVQVVAILEGGEGLLTQGPGSLLTRQAEIERSRYRIDARDFPRPVRFGEFQILPPVLGTKIRFRSGISKDPDPSWLPWSEWIHSTGAVVPLAPARSLQWELELPVEGAADGMVERVEVAYREVNVAPTLQSFEVEEPGVVYLQSPPPSGPVIDVSHPDVSGIFSVITEKGKNGAKNAKGKKYWRVGFRTVSWKAEDANGDPMRFALEIERDDGFRLPVRDHLEAKQLAVDTTAVPDGRYRFHLSASDMVGNPGAAKETVAQSRWIVIDNGAPDIAIDRRGDRWVAAIKDEMSPLIRVEWSRDGGRWQALEPRDGILDGSLETFEIAAEQGRHLLVVRAIDRQHNRATASVTEE